MNDHCTTCGRMLTTGGRCPVCIALAQSSSRIVTFEERAWTEIQWLRSLILQQGERIAVLERAGQPNGDGTKEGA